MPFGEITITLDDVFCLTRLTVDSRAVRVEQMTERISAADVAASFGVTLDEAHKEYGAPYGVSDSIKWLKDQFSGLMTSKDKGGPEVCS